VPTSIPPAWGGKAWRLCRQLRLLTLLFHGARVAATRRPSPLRCPTSAAVLHPAHQGRAAATAVLISEPPLVWKPVVDSTAFVIFYFWQTNYAQKFPFFESYKIKQRSNLQPSRFFIFNKKNSQLSFLENYKVICIAYTCK
jgi:hypothetical protein